MPPGSIRSATISTLCFTSRTSTNSSEKGAYCSRVVQSPEVTSTLGVPANNSCTILASFGSSSALTIFAPFWAPKESQAEPTPHPVPSSASVPPRDAARAASRRPVSLRVEVMKPRFRERSRARATSTGMSVGALMAPVLHAVGCTISHTEHRVSLTETRGPMTGQASIADVCWPDHAEVRTHHHLPRRGQLGQTLPRSLVFGSKFRREGSDHHSDHIFCNFSP